MDYRISKIKELFADRKIILKFTLIIIMIVSAIGVSAYNNGDDITIEESAKETAAEEQTTEGGVYYVDISGAVKSPGVYKADPDTRMFEIIEEAGGLTDDADVDSINRAGFVEDGTKIVIPSKDANKGDVSGSGTGSGSAAPASSGSSNGKISINNAGKDELMEIPGVGEVIAERIIEYRKGGSFKSIDEIKNVKGIGDATYKKMKDSITV